MLDIKITGLETDRHLKFLIVGYAGAGKTLLGSTCPNPFYASCEAGLLSIRDKAIPYHEVVSQKDMDDILLLCRQPSDVREETIGKAIDTLVVDTVDNFQKILKRKRLLETGKEIFSQTDWGWMGELMRSYFAAWRGLDMNVVLTCHLKEFKDEEIGRSTFFPALEGSSRDDIAGEFDLAAVLSATSRTVADGDTTRTVTTRVLKTAPTVNIPWLKDRSGTLPANFEVNLKDDYSRIYELIYKDIAMLDEIDEELRKTQDTMNEGITEMMSKIEEIAPEPAKVEEDKVPDSDVETINSAQFEQLVSPFSNILDQATRTKIKHNFADVYGNPTLLPVSRLDEATRWIHEHVPGNEPEVVEEKQEELPEEKVEDNIVEEKYSSSEEDSPLDPVVCGFDGCEEIVKDQDLIELTRIQFGEAYCEPHFKQASRK